MLILAIVLAIWGHPLFVLGLAAGVIALMALALLSVLALALRAVGVA
jgi:hypothetical protein